MQHWIAYWLGMDDPAGPVYLFYSGFLGGVPVLAAVVLFARHRNCHVHGCWRIGRHPVTGTPYVVCRRHDPDGPSQGPGIRTTKMFPGRRRSVSPPHLAEDGHLR